MKNILFFFVVICLVRTAWAHDVDIQVLNPDGKPVENIVVYITPTSGAEHLKSNTTQLIIGQKNKKFTPYIAVMQKGQSIQFENSDDITHHIYSASGSNRFEFKLKAGAHQETAPLNATEEVAMGCNIHDWMSGFALVVDTPYFGKTNANGVLTFNVETLEAYELVVWHPQLDAKNNRVIITSQLDEVMAKKPITITLPSELKPIPLQESQEEFEFLEEY